MHTYTYKYMFPYVLIDSLTLSHTNPWNVSTCGPSRRHKRSRIHAHTISHMSIHVLYIIMGFHGCLTCLLKDIIHFHTGFTKCSHMFGEQLISHMFIVSHVNNKSQKQHTNKSPPTRRKPDPRMWYMMKDSQIHRITKDFLTYWTTPLHCPRSLM